MARLFSPNKRRDIFDIQEPGALLHSGSFLLNEMKNDNENSIMLVLAEAGERGICVKKLARHLFNASNSFFEPIAFDDVYKYVQSFVRRNSKGAEALLICTERRGYYRLNPNSVQYKQLILDFCDKDEENITRLIDDFSLSLF